MQGTMVQNLQLIQVSQLCPLLSAAEPPTTTSPDCKLAYKRTTIMFIAGLADSHNLHRVRDATHAPHCRITAARQMAGSHSKHILFPEHPREHPSEHHPLEDSSMVRTNIHI